MLSAQAQMMPIKRKLQGENALAHQACAFRSDLQKSIHDNASLFIKIVSANVGSLEDILAKVSSTACVAKLLANEAAKRQLIFDELHGTLSTQHGEIAALAKEFRKVNFPFGGDVMLICV
ncbi:hypothetical protein QVD17_34854 [Tagetes erecta]|uniref:Uncharacterized protein n=1 Tax=Tagetes erecta TaxID=13708 RepID=A0AAD8K2I4_TARER|nr:hypothetical protein QVD17_34854 [Tagetes erecta]